ncbi:MAG: hypothetical protein J6T85_01250 [Paludibacteraceae bacterium]|nr:hypothetical protein [Paludibacteraceae bacterium]
MKKSLFIAVLLLSALTISARPYKHSVGINLGGANGFSYKGYVGDMDQMIVVVDFNAKLSASKGVYTVSEYANKDVEDYCQKTIGKDYGENNNSDVKFVYWTAEINPNLGYQRQIADLSGATLHYIIGGGISLGMAQMSSYDKDMNVSMADAWKNMKDARKAYHDALKAAPSDEEIYVGLGGSNTSPNKTAGSGDFHRPYALKLGINLLTGFEFCFKNAPIALGVDVRPGMGTNIDFTVSKNLNYVKDNQIQAVEKDAVRLYTSVYFDWSAGISLRYFFGN